ncbi:hypothetical protein UA08_00040 [Talaromyces atroroseus]|uniref:Sulphur transport domain-containing protein n=1 Tax=Talaromyces atroroseus TaxID=1441469 RepID=A0A225B9Y9_TALAT|nr:hypothetical protein UA08_00040 [Talaromyces atroroseus]OKL64206.1 hypothetical protein UA08_00040 [Talaromyces atroroseus]
MFTPVHTTIGALLLFSGSFGLLLHNGRVFGISSILRSCLLHPGSFKDENNFPIVAGLVSSPLLVKLVVPSLLPSYPQDFSPTTTPPASPWVSAATTVGLGVLTGWGTKNDQGCTSGHMLSGMSRLSPRSIIATAIFFTTGLLVANLAPSSTGHTLIPPCENGPCYYPIYPNAFEVAVMGTTCIASLLTTFVFGPKILTRSSNSRRLFAYLAGIQFGLGLLFSGMADPAKVIRFFSFAGNTADFDPSLALIILFAIGPSLYGYLTVEPGKPDVNGNVKAPTLADTWSLSQLTVADIDWRFVVGAMVFGLAWGLSGVCPGPAILRSVLQPVWGILWMSGYFLGGLI